METVDIFSMFTLGLLAQGHCIGMCGPLIIAFPGRSGVFMPHLYYHFGRITTYCAAGAFMAAIGGVLPQIAATMSSDPQVWLACGQIRFFLDRHHVSFSFRYQPNRPDFRTCMDGGRNPCTHSRIPPDGPGGPSGQQGGGDGAAGADDGAPALRAVLWRVCPALPAESVIKGMLLTGAFGLGTLPGLLLLGTGIGAIMRRFRRQSDILSGLLMLGMGLNLLFRTANLMLML